MTDEQYEQLACEFAKRFKSPRFQTGSPWNPLPGTRRCLGLLLGNETITCAGVTQMLEQGEDPSELQAYYERAKARIAELTRAGVEDGLLTADEAAVLTGDDDRAAHHAAGAIRYGGWPESGPDLVRRTRGA